MSLNNRRSEALRTRVHLQSRGLVDDGFGNMVPGGEFTTIHTVWANLHPLKGSETVISARLEGRQPYLMTVRQSSDTRQVNEAWRVVEKVVRALSRSAARAAAMRLSISCSGG